MRKPHEATPSREIEDTILPLPFLALPAATDDVRPPALGQPSHLTLIFADAAECSATLAAGIAALGRRSIVVHTPLDALFRLQNGAATVDAVFVSLQDADGAAFFEFLRDEHPCVRRIAFAQHESTQVDSPLTAACQHDMILWDPWDREDFSETLKDALNCRAHRKRSSWSDLELFRSSRGTDALAISEIVKRYRHRIVRLTLDATSDVRDTEDIVQATCLALIEGIPSFVLRCSPGQWIDDITHACIRAFSSRDAGFVRVRSGHA